MPNIKIKKKNNKIYVYENNELMWTQNLINPLRSWGATRFREYADEYLKRKDIKQ